jgi:HSP20 family protein
MAEKMTDAPSRERQQSTIMRRDPVWSMSPFRMLERFADEIDSVFDDFGLGRSFLSPRFPQGSMRTPAKGSDSWAPQIEVSEQNNELLIHADLPGMKKEDVAIDITEHELTLSGERRQERQSEQGGIYRSERSYGRFYRTIPLPEGAMTDQAKATFKDGVLEIRMPAPPDQVRRGRRIEISDGGESRK